MYALNNPTQSVVRGDETYYLPFFSPRETVFHYVSCEFQNVLTPIKAAYVRESLTNVHEIALQVNESRDVELLIHYLDKKYCQ